MILDRLHDLPIEGRAPAEGSAIRRSVPGRTTRVEALQFAAVAPRDPAPGRAQAIADRGVSGAGAAVPHHDRIQRLFGRHDVGHVQAYVGGEASAACDELGARAYATGAQVAFAEPPDLHTAAHELAHVVQQRGGVALAGGVGQAGDAHERHADAVADQVVRGESAEALLDAYAGGASGVRAVQRWHPDHAEGTRGSRRHGAAGRTAARPADHAPREAPRDEPEIVALIDDAVRAVAGNEVGGAS
jgi:hypothetical protein